MGETEQTSLCLFGVRSPLIEDYMESCLRLNIRVDHAVQVDKKRPRLSKGHKVVQLKNLGANELDTPFIAVAFSPHRRCELVELAISAGLKPHPALIDTSAVVASTSIVGSGSYVNTMSVIASASRIGEHVFINRSCNLGHHVLIGDYVSIGPGVTITSNVRIGTSSIVGAGAIILPGITIGDNCLVSAGSRVSRDIPEGHITVCASSKSQPIRGGKKFLYLPDQE